MPRHEHHCSTKGCQHYYVCSDRDCRESWQCPRCEDDERFEEFHRLEQAQQKQMEATQ